MSVQVLSDIYTCYVNSLIAQKKQQADQKFDPSEPVESLENLSIDEIVDKLITDNTIHLGGLSGSGRTSFIANLVNSENPPQLLYLTQTKVDADKFLTEFKHIRPGVGYPEVRFGPLPIDETNGEWMGECRKLYNINYVIIDDASNYKGITARQHGLYKTYRSLWTKVEGIHIKTIIIHVH